MFIAWCGSEIFSSFVMFPNFSQSYDLVPRTTLFSMLRQLGFAMYHVIHSVIRKAIITATVGLQQGSPTICFNFALFINDLSKPLRENWDGFLSWILVLVLIYDMVFVSMMGDGKARKFPRLIYFYNTLSVINNGCIF